MMKKVFLSLLTTMLCLPAVFAQVDAGMVMKVDTVNSCLDYTWNRDNVTYTTDTVSVFNAGDTIFVLYFNKLQATGDTSVAKVLNGDCSVTYEDQEYTKPGTYIYTYANTEGCDSLVKLQVMLSKVDTTYSETVCGSFVAPWKMVYSESQVIDTTITSGNCTYRTVIKLTVNPEYEGIEEKVVAGCYYVWQGDTITDTEEHNLTLKTVNGCDSAVALTVTEYTAMQRDTLRVAACDSYTTPWGLTVNESGFYNDTISTDEDCNNIQTIEVTIVASNNDTANTTPVSITGGCYYLWNGDTITDQDVHYHLYSSVIGGCDSLAAIQVTYTGKHPDTTFVHHCGNSFDWKSTNSKLPTGNYVYTKDTIVSVEVASKNGNCDTVYTLVLTFGDKYDTVNQYYCGTEYKYTYRAQRTNAAGTTSWQNVTTTFTAPGMYTMSDEGDSLITIQASTGCKSYHTLNLDLNIPEKRYRKDTTFAEACESYRFKADTKYGNWVTFKTSVDTDVTYSERSQIYPARCYDSIAHLTLTINKNQHIERTQRACDTYTWMEGDTTIGTYTESGIYLDTLAAPTDKGCLQIARLTLTIFETPQIDIQGDWMLQPGESTVLTAVPSEGSDPIDNYRWYIDDATTPASTSETLTVSAISQNTDIRLESTAKHGSLSCIAKNYLTITCNVGIDDVDALSINVYPNPASRFLHIESASVISMVEMFNTVGQRVMVQSANSQSLQLDLAGLAEGSYSLRIIGQNGELSTRKIIISK